jgi:hypothetical protein
MEVERDVLVSPTTEVPVLEGQVVTAIRTLAGRGVGKKTIAREVGVALNTVRRYLREPIEAGRQVRRAARRLTDGRRQEARTLYDGPAGGNAVIVQRLPRRAWPHAQCSHRRASGGGPAARATGGATGDGARRNPTRGPAPN